MLTYVRYASLSHSAINSKDDLLSNFNWGGDNRVIYVLGLGVKCSHTLDMLRFHILRLIAKMTYSPILIGEGEG